MDDKKMIQKNGRLKKNDRKKWMIKKKMIQKNGLLKKNDQKKWTMVPPKYY